MSEVNAHLNEAKRFLTAAKADFERGDYKRCVSSAYYCAFHCAKAALLTEGISPKTHEGVLRKFGELFVKKKKFPRELGVSLKDLRRWREGADYVPGCTFSKGDATRSIKKAKEFLERIEEYLEKIGRE
jgi:hypothetical protein